MRVISITEDYSKEPGNAIVTLQGVPDTPGEMLVSFQRHGAQDEFLSPGGWQAAECWFAIEQSVRDPGGLFKFAIGPELVHEIEPQAYELRLRVGEQELSNTFPWPDVLEPEDENSGVQDINPSKGYISQKSPVSTTPPESESRVPSPASDERGGLDSEYDENGYDSGGFNKDGFDKEGFGKEGFNKDGFNKDGFDRDGFNRGGFDRYGYDKDGYNSKGFDRLGFDRNGLNAEGFDVGGFDSKGFDKEGFNRKGFNQHGLDREGYNAEGFDRNGFDRNGKNHHGLTPEQLRSQQEKKSQQEKEKQESEQAGATESERNTAESEKVPAQKPEVPKKQKPLEQSARQPQNSGNLPWLLGFIVVLISLGGLAYYFLTSDDTPQTSTQTSPAPAPAPTVNQAPEANDDKFVITQEQAVLNVLKNDRDPDNDPLTLVRVSDQPGKSNAAVKGDSVRLTTASGATGTDRFTYVVSDGQEESQGEVDITYQLPVATASTPEPQPQSPTAPTTPSPITPSPTTAESTPPEARDDRFFIKRGEFKELPVLSNDKGDQLRIVKLDESSAGLVRHDGQIVTYSWFRERGGEDIFNYTVEDQQGRRAQARIIIQLIE